MLNCYNFLYQIYDHKYIYIHNNRILIYFFDYYRLVIVRSKFIKFYTNIENYNNYL